MGRHNISPPETLNTTDEGLFQPLRTAFAAGTGEKRWYTTSEWDETSCHNSTSASKSASCLSFSRDVIATRVNQNSFTNGHEIPPIVS